MAALYKDVRNRNISAILSAVAANDGVVRSELSEICGISVMTVGKIMDLLVSRGAVYEHQADTALSGRKPVGAHLVVDRHAICVYRVSESVSVHLMRLDLSELHRIEADGLVEAAKLARDYLLTNGMELIGSALISDLPIDFDGETGTEAEYALYFLEPDRPTYYLNISETVTGIMYYDDLEIPGRVGDIRLGECETVNTLLGIGALRESLGAVGVSVNSPALPIDWNTNAEIISLINSYAHRLADVVSNIICLFSPERILIDGSHHPLGEQFFDAFNKNMTDSVEISFIYGGCDNALAGAAKKVRDGWITDEVK